MAQKTPVAGDAQGVQVAQVAQVMVQVPEVAEVANGRDGSARIEWARLREEVAGCRACKLAGTRQQTVFGVGNEAARWLLVGEAPGADEDERGEPFVGQAGKLLDNILASMSMTRERDVFIANVLKCRPPQNRDPEPGEVACCEPFLRRQAELVDPDLIVVMGRFAARALLGTDASISSLRGRLHHYTVAGREVPVVVTYHPAYLLRNLKDKALAWVDWSFARQARAQAQTLRAGP